MEPPKSSWINVKERLPKKSGWYLTFAQGGVFEVAGFRKKKDMDGEHWDAYDVTHWMPLPAPPQD